MFLIDIISVHPLLDRHLELTFENGLRAVVDLDVILKRYTGIFEPLLDDNYFKRVEVNAELGTIVWPNGADIFPDVLYSVASGQVIVDVSLNEYGA